MSRDVIIACDFASGEDTYSFLEKFKEEKPFVKIVFFVFLFNFKQFLLKNFSAFLLRKLVL